MICIVAYTFISYDENGEVGEQASWVDEYWLLPKIREARDYLYSQIL